MREFPDCIDVDDWRASTRRADDRWEGTSGLLLDSCGARERWIPVVGIEAKLESWAGSFSSKSADCEDIALLGIFDSERVPRSIVRGSTG